MAWGEFRGIANYLQEKSGIVARLKKWRAFAALTGFDVNKLEPFVSSLRVSDGPHIRTLSNPKLPIDLATLSGARLIGYYGDSNNRNGAFTNKDYTLHMDFRDVVKEVLGDITITETVSARGGFGEGKYIRTNVGYLVPSALSAAGFDNTRDQKLANNPFPSWLFDCPPQIRSECLSALWDAEGCVRSQDVKVSQTVPVTLYPEEYIPEWPDNKPFKHLGLDNQSLVLANPPLLLVSAAVMLCSFGIVSRLSPQKAYVCDGISTAYWWLRVQRVQSIRAFHSSIVLRSPRKQAKLNSLV
ncbi:MAG: hypothetical protein OK456_06060 [Thaumarchaeota archaeon]|nr:hypothetical protein [Nitrososphaerota archaeon]